MVPENEHFYFVVTHVEADGQFLKIWAQTNERLVQSVNAVLLSLQEKLEYDGGPDLCSPGGLTPHTSCLARGLPKTGFARAKILNLRSDGMVMVQFVDHGNVTYVPLHNIRLSDNSQEINFLFSLPKTATAFVVADVLPIGGSWMDDVIKMIRSILINSKYHGVYRMVNNVKVLRFNIMNEDFSQTLIKRNMALFSPFGPSNMQQLMSSAVSVQPLRTPHQSSSINQENWRAPISHNVTPIQKVAKSNANAFKAIQLEINSFHDVRISYVEEGPWKFCVQLLESLPFLDDMMNKINALKHIPLQEPPIAGQVCLGRQSHTGKVARVVLNSPGDTTCKVYYVDYGYHEVLPFSSIYQIPDEFVIPNIFSIRFTLFGITNWTVSLELKDYFSGIVLNENMKLRVCKGPMSPLTQYCDLFRQNGQNVKEILIENFPDLCVITYPEPKRLQSGARESVYVSFVECITKFYIQLESDARLLEEVMMKIELMSSSAPKLVSAKVRPEMPCIALYAADQKWYRAFITQVMDQNRVKVFYVDYGNEELVSTNNIRVIIPELVQILPKQAIKCSLNGFQSGSMDKELTKSFESLVLDEQLTLTVLNTHSNTVIVDLCDGEHIPASARKDIAGKLKALENSKKQGVPHESPPKPLQTRPQNDNNWNEGTWEKDQRQAKSYNTKPNNYELYEGKPKYRKDNENEKQQQRHDNHFRKNSGSDFASNGPSQNNRFQQKTNNDFQPNDRFNRSGAKENLGGGGRSSVSARLERSYGSDRTPSDKDSDTSSRSGGRRSNRGGRRGGDDQRRRDGPPSNRNRIGRWEDEQASNDPRENDNQRKSFNGDMNAPRSKPYRDNNNVSYDKQNKNSNWESSPKAPAKTSQTPSTPAAKIPPPNITVGAVKNCTIVYYISPANFIVQLCPDNEGLDAIMDKIYAIYDNGGKVLQAFDIKPGMQCIAQYSGDEQWYRAVVQTAQASTATVHFVDYGNVETVSYGKIKEIQPEFVKLPAQGIHCKLFCPHKLDYTKEESDRFSNALANKSLETEFVTEENGIYHVLMKEKSCDKYINDMFANGVDLMKQKDALRNKSRTMIRGETTTVPPDYVALDDKWLENKLEPGNKQDVHITWFMNPENFYCQILRQTKEFRDMMNEIQTAYARRSPVSEKLKVGSSVIAVLPDDGVLYRAEVVELNKPLGHVVQYVDYGDRAMVDRQKVFPVERKFTKLPKQAVFCGLKNIAPPSGSNWSNSAETEKYFNVEKLECTFLEFKNNKYLTSLKNKGNDLASALVDKNLAILSTTHIEKITNGVQEEPEVLEKIEVPRIDINLLEGQTLYVRVSSVEGVSKFYVQFYTADGCQITVDNYMAKKDPQMMPRLSCHEVCIGAGCLVKCRGKWKRGVVINFTKTNYEVRLIDTGEHETISLNSMLGLPGQLSVMQNQAIECALFDVPLSSKADETLKKTVTGKDVKIFVEKVECNRLVVRLFDANGNKIKVVDTQNTERISPICSMQILSSTHDVSVTWINDSNSVWLQRTADVMLEQNLLQALYDYYSVKKEQVVSEENGVYAALSGDGNWYRAKVLKVIDNKATINLIDYGNVEDISIDDIRTLEPQFYLPHQLSIEVSLTVSLAGNDDEQRKILNPLLDGKVFSAVFYNVNRKWVAELSENGEKLSDKLVSTAVVNKTTKPQFEGVELADMVVGEKYDVMVSHVNNPNQLWLQRSEELNAIAELQSQLQEASSLYLDCKGVPEEKSLCLAMYSFDNLWYRAEVLDADDDITTVRFIDYGNTDIISNSTSKLKQLPEKWKAVKKYAIQCKLDVVPVNADDWTEDACARISDLVIEKCVQALIIADKAPMRVDLFVEDQSACKLLVDEKLAAYLQSPEEFEEEIIDEVQLDPRSAFVSCMISVDQFWMQEDKMVNDLEMLGDRLVMASMLPSVQKVEDGLLCIAHFPDDGLYYRATILGQAEEGTKVRYVDYGNVAVTKDLRAIPDDLAAIKPLSKKCRLAKPDGVEHWPHSINEEFNKLAADGATVFLLDVIEEGETNLIKLTHEDKDVAIELLEQCNQYHSKPEDEGIVIEEAKTIITEERPSPIGEENSVATDVCTVSYVTSPAEFWIQMKSHYGDLDQVCDSLIEAELFDVVSEIKEGKILAAKFHEDNLWYRSKVLSHGEKGTEVLYIDYGNTAVTESIASLRELPENLARISPVAVCCALKRPDGVETWSRIACEKFMSLAEGGTVEFQYKNLDNRSASDMEQPLQLELHHEGQDVIELLLSHEKTLQGIEVTVPKDAENSSGDSAVIVEQHRLEVNVQSSISTSTNESVVVQDLSGSVEINHDARLCSTEIEIHETVISSKTAEDENKTTSSLSMSINDQGQKIDVSDGEIVRFSPTHGASSPEQKIVPKNCSNNKDGASLNATDDLVNDDVHESNESDKVCDAEDMKHIVTDSTTISHDDGADPSCISKSEIPVDLSDPSTPKNAHADKLVADTVNAQLLYEEEDEIIAVVVNEDIPKSSEN